MILKATPPAPQIIRSEAGCEPLSVANWRGHPRTELGVKIRLWEKTAGTFSVRRASRSGLQGAMSMIAIPLCDGFFESRTENTSRFPSGDQTGWLAFRSLSVTCRRPVPSGLMMNAPASCCGFPRVDVNAICRPMPAQLHGSIDKEGELEWGFIEPGMKLMFFLNGDRPVKTSRIISVKVAQPNAVQPKSSPSVH